jgi:hypothetical protein
MQIARITAVHTEKGVDRQDYKVVLLCGLNEHRILVDGEWFGRLDNAGETYPFVLERGQRLFYGGEENSSERTNVGEKPLTEGSYFTIFGEQGEAVYRITRLHIL